MSESTRRRAVALIYGALCSSLFVVSVATMIVMMFYGLSRSLGPLHAPLSWIANGFLLLQFPVMHSFLLSRPGRTIVGRLAPFNLGSDLATTTYVVIASVQVALLFTLWSPTGTIWWRAEGLMRVVSCGLYAAAWVLLFKSLLDAGLSLQAGYLGWVALLKNVRPVYPKMPTSGLFRFCRQPIYVAFTLTVWTVPTWTPDQLFLATVLTTYCLIGPLFKEQRFRRQFGVEFAAFSRRVSYWVPMLSRPALRNDLSIYDTHADAWWGGRHRWLRTLQNVVSPRLEYFDTFVSDWRDKAVLDLGCGGGFMAEALARRGADVIGVDPSQPAIESAKAHAVANSLRIDYRVGTGERVPVTSHSIDYLVCVDVLEHVENVDDVLHEVHRILKPGGLFLFDTINRTVLASLVFVSVGESLLRIAPPGLHDPAKFIPPSDLRTLLVKRGFEVGTFVGLGPRGVDRHLDFTFGRIPVTTLSYLGHARAPAQPAAP
jgi:ubiquinone biosynthesis O-methyltransferase